MSSAKTGNIKGYALVRDKHGRPRIDEPAKIPKEIFDQLSKEDKEYIYGPNTRDSIKKYIG